LTRLGSTIFLLASLHFFFCNMLQLAMLVDAYLESNHTLHTMSGSSSKNDITAKNNDGGGNGGGGNDDVDVSTSTTTTTQDAVPGLIAALYRADTELVKPTEGPDVVVKRDPHLRLRRTLTPSLNVGLKSYNEAQFTITGSTGKRIDLEFQVFDRKFRMDAYVWGASESDAKMRMVAVHGISPGISRTRWHKLGGRLVDEVPERKIRYVALDWHSIDRTDEPQVDFLTMLPKHIFSAPKSQPVRDELISMHATEEGREWMRGAFRSADEYCPRGFDDGADILKAVIRQGLGWGTPTTRFVLGTKSWSGGVGVQLLAKSAHNDPDFKRNVAGAVIMHPACFYEAAVIRDAVNDLPDVLVGWAKDDGKAPYKLLEKFLGAGNENIKVVSYESGGHANFDGEDNLPNFDDDIVAWIRRL